MVGSGLLWEVTCEICTGRNPQSSTVSPAWTNLLVEDLSQVRHHEEQPRRRFSGPRVVRTLHMSLQVSPLLYVVLRVSSTPTDFLSSVTDRGRLTRIYHCTKYKMCSQFHMTDSQSSLSSVHPSSGVKKLQANQGQSPTVYLCKGDGVPHILPQISWRHSKIITKRTYMKNDQGKSESYLLLEVTLD